MRSSTILLCAFAAFAAVPAGAQSQRSGGAGNAQVMQQLQQLAGERTALQAENARLKRELDQTKKERDELKGGKESDDKRAKNSEIALARASREREQSTVETDQLKGKMQELVAKFRETIQELRTVESDRTQVKQQLETRDTELKSCVDNNVSLYKLNDEILTRFEKQGFWTGVAKAEPFTKLKRTQLENLAEGYRDRAEDAKAQPAATVPVMPKAAPGG